MGGQHITQSKDTARSWAASGTTAPDFGGAMGGGGVTADGVWGARAWISPCRYHPPTFSELHDRTDAQVTGAHKGAYKVAIFICTGKTDVDGRVAGREWRIAYRAFGCSPSIVRPRVLHISMD